MKIAFTFRNFDSSEWLKSYAADKLVKLQKLAQAPLAVTLTFSVERHQQCVDLSVQAGADAYLVREQHEDMYAAIDLALDKLKRQFERNKRAHQRWRRPVPAFSH